MRKGNQVKLDYIEIRILELTEMVSKYVCASTRNKRIRQVDIV